MKLHLKTSALLLVSFFAFACSTTKGQTRTDLTNLDKTYQTCLDKGTSMVNCTQVYYKEMDSLLNVVYYQLSKSLNAAHKAALETEQLQWLKQRDAYFKQVDLKTAAEGNLNLGGNDSRMIALDEKALYVRKRVEQLLSKLDK